MTRRPTIADAHAICDRLGSRAVLVIALDRDHVAAASYGDTKRECAAASAIVDRIVAKFEAGRFDWPPGER